MRPIDTRVTPMSGAYRTSCNIIFDVCPLLGTWMVRSPRLIARKVSWLAALIGFGAMLMKFERRFLCGVICRVAPESYSSDVVSGGVGMVSAVYVDAGGSSGTSSRYALGCK